MTKQQAHQRIEKLRREVEHYRTQYHVYDKQEISDAALDALKHELQTLEDTYPDLITPDSPTQRVGGEPLAQFVKVEHTTPMYSMTDVFSTEELAEYEARTQRFVHGAQLSYFVEVKYDGLAVSLTYKDGLLVNGATRGNGRVGEDVTHNLKTIDSIPLRLTPVAGQPQLTTGELVVRGEVLLPKKAFAAVNAIQKKAGLPTYANPRNLAAGTIRQLDPKIAAARKLDFMAYEIASASKQTTHQQEHEWLRALGFKTSNDVRFAKNLSEVQTYIADIQKHRESFAYQTDGAVVLVNDVALQRRLGTVGKTRRWTVAYKFPAEETTTVVQQIRVQIGRTGVLTPVAEFTPVRIAGTTVSRATLHNQDEIDRLDVRVGDTVIIRKAGDIIPEVVAVLPKLRPAHTKKFHMPKKCPICGSSVMRAESEVAYRCSNKNCFAVEIEGLKHAVGRKGLDIVGLGEKIIEQLVDEGLVRTMADVFELTEGDVQPLERFAEKKASKLIAAIAARKTIPLARWLFALGIRMVGEENAQVLAEVVARDLKKKKLTPGAVGKYFHEKPIEEFDALDGIGEKIAQQIKTYFVAPAHLRMFAELDRIGMVLLAPEKNASVLAGKTFVFTGTLVGLSRDEAKETVRRLGGQVSGSVSTATDYVVAGEAAGSKLNRAKELGVRIISEADFAQMTST